MRLIRALTIPLAFTITLPVSAATLTDDEISEITATMFQTYQVGGAPAMLAQETQCWDDFDTTADDATAERVYAACVVAALSGALIERGYAMRQIRGVAGAYQTQAFGDRVKDRASRRYTEEQTAGMDPIADDWLSKVIIGLMAAGMP
jgi:hypothetical protein